jgi:hypothetical protein
MTWDGDVSELRSGASNPEDEYFYGLSPAASARLAEEILAEDSAPASTPLPGPRRNGHPDGYANPRKWD